MKSGPDPATPGGPGAARGPGRRSETLPGIPDWGSIDTGAASARVIYRRLLGWAVGRDGAARLTRRNTLTAPYLWLLCMLAVIPSVLFWDDSRILGLCIVLFGFGYLYLYRRLVRFRTPRWLRTTR